MSYNYVKTNAMLIKSLMQLVTCIVCWAISLPFFYNKEEVRDWWMGFFSPENATNAYTLFSIVMVIVFFTGLRAIALLTSSPSAWRSNPGDLSNIDTILQYRDSRLKGMTNADGSQLMRDTQILDAGRYSSNSETAHVMEYMNARLGGMTNEQGLNFLKDSSKK